MSISLLLMIVAAVLFFVSAFGVASSRINLNSLGLALLTLAFIAQGITLT